MDTMRFECAVAVCSAEATLVAENGQFPLAPLNGWGLEGSQWLCPEHTREPKYVYVDD